MAVVERRAANAEGGFTEKPLTESSAERRSNRVLLDWDNVIVVAWIALKLYLAEGGTVLVCLVLFCENPFVYPSLPRAKPRKQKIPLEKKQQLLEREEQSCQICCSDTVSSGSSFKV